MKAVFVLYGLACGLALVAAAARAAPTCVPATMTTASDGTASPGRSFLGQGIALFEARNLKLAERTLESALLAGLSDSQERASAHKYLALVACSNREWARCESEFEAAFATRSTFALEPYEIAQTPWREVYLRVQSQQAARCGVPQGLAFALTSTVVLGIEALAVTASWGGAPSAALPFEPAALRAGNNLRLRVSPWAYVQVDGKRVGVTPALTQLKLNPGSHVIELINPGFETVRQVVQLSQDQPTLISHDFDAR